MHFTIFHQLLPFYFAVNFLVDASESNVTCVNKEDCIKNYTPNFAIAREYNSTIVEEPFCSNSTGINEDRFCTCGEFCKSRSISRYNDTVFYYCGPCGRLGSECSEGIISCASEVSICINGYCECKRDGTFFDLYYCYIPYHGYEVALQLAVATCIIIAICLILVSIYNAIGVHRLRRIQTLRALLRRDNGNRRTGPEDAPPKYDDVVEDLPTYQDALRMDQNEPERKGLNNLAFENDESDSTNSDMTVMTSAEGSSKNSGKEDDILPEYQHITSTDLPENESGCLKNDINKDGQLSLNSSSSFKESNRTGSLSS